MRLPAALLASAALAAGCAAPQGQEPGARRIPDDDVVFTLVPYAWNADVAGEATAGGVSASTDEDDSTRVRGGTFEAHLDRVSLLLDGFWVHAGASDFGVEGDARYGRFDLAVALRILGEPAAPVEARPSPVAPFVDGIAGLRGHFAGLSADPPGFTKVEQDVGWAEPMAGGRAGITILRRVTLFGRADASGIAYSRWHSAAWGAEAGVRLDLAAGLGAFVGARWARVRVGEDDDDDGVDETFLDLRLKGLWAGLVLEF